MTKRLLAVAVLGASLALAACAPSQEAGDPTVAEAGYEAGDGTFTTWAPEDRAEAPVIAGETFAGDPVDLADWRGDVVVLNFWYAACPPCRAEAPDLEALAQTYQPDGVVFIGVNVRDSADTAAAFENQFGITYPSILDATTGTVQAAFAGKAAPGAVPTTIVLDRTGRMAARIIGQLPTRTTLAALIDTVLAETSP